MTSKRSSAGAIVIAVAVMVVLFFGSFMVGQYPIDPVGVVEIIGAQLFGFDCSQSDMAQTIVWKVRLPRICSALLVAQRSPLPAPCTKGFSRTPWFRPTYWVPRRVRASARRWPSFCPFLMRSSK